ncbi:alpha-2,8-sialyltransferase 8B-like [Ptychodera flava]|uniref:alpha-2,8-sialyltransferase 8B-like n=1 Tax=Ptychodera flava TaxID=63121 RepID=UPI00396A5719
MSNSRSPFMTHILRAATIRKLFFYAVLFSLAVLIMLSQNTTPKSKVRRKLYVRGRQPQNLPKISSKLKECLKTLKMQNITAANYSQEQVPLKDPRTVRSWQELRDIVSKMLHLETTIAVRRSITNPNDNFPQNFWSPGVALPGCLRKFYDELYYTLQQQTSCALVGNGGILNNSHCGSAIDGHDFVMRVNLPEITGYEDDVGQKTNLTAINNIVGLVLNRQVGNMKKFPAQQALRTLASLNNSVVWFSYNMSYTGAKIMKGSWSRFQAVLKRTKLERHDMTYKVAYSPIPVWPQMMTRLWNKTTNSEGFLLLTVSALFCQELTLYGFWPFPQDSRGNYLPHHYYEEGDYNFTHRNTIPEEFEILQNFNRSNVIRLVSDKCTERNEAR